MQKCFSTFANSVKLFLLSLPPTKRQVLALVLISAISTTAGLLYLGLKGREAKESGSPHQLASYSSGSNTSTDVQSVSIADVRSSKAKGISAPDTRASVYVCGEVVRPGVYELKGDLRIIDAVNAAGGLTEKADVKCVNLAERLSDGQMVYIPSEGEQAPSPSASTFAKSPLLSINSASPEELERLPGIGPELASRIVAHRQKHGPFRSVEQLLEVPGIGKKKLEKIKDLVRV